MVFLAFLCDITEKLGDLNRRLQGELKIISQLASKVFAFEDKLKMYIEEINNKKLHNFPALEKAQQDGIDVSPENYATISSYLVSLSNEFQDRFKDLRKIKKCLLLVENPWHLEVATTTELAVLGFDSAKLSDELIDFKNDTNLEAIFKEKREANQYVEFWRLVPDNYETLKNCAHLLLTLFASTYLCESSYSRMKYAKNVYRSRLTDSHLDDVLRVACSNYVSDLSKIVKSLPQCQKSH